MVATTMTPSAWFRSTGLRSAILFATLLASLLYVFRSTIFSGFHLFYGDSVDALIEVAILEHWWNVLHYHAVWNETGYFFPYVGTLGYNDTYLIPSSFFIVARTFGLDPFVSTFVSHAVMKSIGFFGMYILLRRICRIEFLFALSGAVFFTVSNATILQMWHGQLTHLGLIPWLYILGWNAGRGMFFGDRKALLRYGIAFALLYGVTALSAFYFIWFFTFYNVVFGAVLLALSGNWRAELAQAMQRHAKDLLFLAVVLIIALVPLAIVYFSKLESGSKHPWIEVYDLLPDPFTLFNAGPGNLIWGDFLSAFNARFLPGNLWDGEDMVGFPIFSVLCSAAALIWGWRHRATGTGRVVLAGLSALACVALFTLRIPGVGSLWHGVFAVVPGGNAIRAITRFFLFGTLIQFAALMVWLDRSQWQRITKIGVLVLLFAEQVQLRPPVAVNRPEQLKWLNEVAAIPSECKAIFVISARTDAEIATDLAQFPVSVDPAASARSMTIIWRHNVDAMLLSAFRATPTIQGYSTFSPPDWNFDRFPPPLMASHAKVYAQRHGVTGLCAIDRRTSEEWTRVS